MSSSYLNWLSPTAILFALSGCSAPAGQWTTVPAADNGGFTVMFPVEGGLQDGSLQLGQETIPSHVNIVADSGITYVSGWFTLTENMLRIPKDHLLDSIWQIMPADPVIIGQRHAQRVVHVRGQCSARGSVAQME